MDIRSFYLAQLNKEPYDLNLRNGQFASSVTEVGNSPYYLGWFQGGPDALTAGIDVHQVLPRNGVDHLCVVGAHNVHRVTPASPWITDAVVDYIGGCPMFPIIINDFSIGEVVSAGRWSWRNYNEAGEVTTTGAGDWNYDSKYNLSFGRFIWDEKESERHDDTGQVIPYHRVHQYDSNGWLGFVDLLDPAASTIRG